MILANRPPASKIVVEESIGTQRNEVHMAEQDALLNDLTPAQREAVLHMNGPLLILAGAGSGKTRVITRRIVWLQNAGVRPSQILAITFTNKAAGEMRQRVEAMLPGTRVWISTFHSFGVRMLRQYADRLGVEKNFTIYDQADRLRMVKVAMEDARVSRTSFTPDAIQGGISKAKNQLLSPAAFARDATDFFRQTVATVYGVYEKRMRDANALDFDDLIYWPALALKNDPELRSELDERFRYVLVDEYQDTNKAQYAIARGLSMDHPNLCVVGDPDQSIYKWRGSDIRNILDFERDFPNARVIMLERNYRSTKAILHAASTLIDHNEERKRKTLYTENPAGAPVRVLYFENGLDEAEQIADRIKKAVAQGRRFRDFAVFVRVNALSRALETAFVKQRVPFQIVRGLAFFERKENRDVCAYLRLLLNPRDDLSFERIINEPSRGIGKTSLEYLRQYAEPRGVSLLEAAAQADKIATIKGKAALALRTFAGMMSELRRLADLPPDELITRVIDRSGYRAMLAESHDDDDQERLANIEELVTAAQQFRQEDENRTLADFLENITLASDVDGWDEKQDCVSIMTLHAAKGLEFPVVYMIAVEQGLLPHERSLSEKGDREEERRLAFVGMTRAMEELYLCHCRLREYRGETLYAVPSMFLEELPADGVERIDLSTSGGRQPRPAELWRGGRSDSFAAWRDAGIRVKEVTLPKAKRDKGGDFILGMHVRHETYGVGQITSVSGYGAMRKLKIRFGAAGERSFLANQAKLEILQEHS
jgi:DNA helicase-2/ATP-dependent DNA helicase PcrA